MADSDEPPAAYDDASEDPAAEAIQRANEELEGASDGKFDLPVTVLIRQRDDALRDSLVAAEKLDAKLQKLRAEHDKLAESLVSEHQTQIQELKREHAAALDELRKSLVNTPTTGATHPGMGAVTGTNSEALILREQLAEALSSLEAARQEANDLQEELQAAVVSYDDMRQEMWNAAQDSRDEAAGLRIQGRELSTRLEDERAANVEAVKELKRETARVQHELDEVLAQTPGPPNAQESKKTTKPEKQRPKPTEPAIQAARVDEERAKEEAHELRMELINAKRSLNKKSQQLHAAKQELRRSRRAPSQAVRSSADLDARVAKLSEEPAFQRFLKRRERTLGTYSDGGSVDVVDARVESTPPSAAARKTEPAKP